MHALPLDDLPVLIPRPHPHAPVRALTAAQFAQLHLAHAVADPPDSTLFPFLHGLESDNHQQSAFFAKPPTVPNYRGLIWVVADDPDEHAWDEPMDEDDDEDDEDDYEDEDLYVHDTPHPEFMHPVHSVRTASPSTSSSSSLADSWHTHSTGTSMTSNPSLCLSSSSSLPSFLPRSHLLTSTFLPSELLSNSPNGPVFTPPKVPDGVSLRNFGIQTPLYATLSDVVVYSPKGPTRAALAVAERFKRAIESKAHERAARILPNQSPLLAYNVFVVTDPFTTFETQLPSLVAIASDGSPTANYPDLANREKDEMRILTRASEIIPGAWLGNAADVPVWHTGDSDDPCCSTNNLGGYDICIECHDGAPFPSAAHLRQAEDHLGAMDALWGTGFDSSLGGCTLTPSLVSNHSAPPRPPPNANAVVHLSCPSSPLSTQTTVNHLLGLVDFLNRAIRSGASCAPSSPFSLSPSRPVSRRPLKILLHSADGYTDSSVLALCLIMSQKHCTLPEAYLELQVNRSRSFFVYQQDLALLKRVECKILPSTPGSKRDKSHERSRERWGWTFSRTPSSSGGTLPLSSSAPSSPTPLAIAPPPPPSSPPPSPRRARASTSSGVPCPTMQHHHTWFNDPRFDGSFPSRVLPFLYLGNLNHASNAYMLHALGITHVVSVGECALVPPPALPPNAGPGVAGGAGARVGSFAPGSGPHQHGSLWIEEREGRIKVLDIKGVCDDGIDSLRGQFEPICDWIDKARLEGGQVLIHCRVGVSRSATVTIAYVMKHLSLPLIDAYLIVRSRRLSVLIQPNMRLLYNLCGWEIELARAQVDAEHASLGQAEPDAEHAEDVVPSSSAAEQRAALLRQKLSRSLSWPYLAREVHLLNEKYLT